MSTILNSEEEQINAQQKETRALLKNSDVDTESIEASVLEEQQLSDYLRRPGAMLNAELHDTIEKAHEYDVQQGNKNFDSFRINFTEALQTDPNASFKRARRLTHDVMYEDSTEDKIRDFFERRSLQKEYSRPLSIEEAHSLSRELGAEIKYDKEVTEGDVRFDVAQKKHKEYLEQTLAQYRAGKSYNVWQNALLAGSAISGSIGAAELAATMGLTYFMGLGLAGLAARAAEGASAAGASNALIQGIKYANASKLAEKNVRIASKVAQRAKKNADVQKTLRAVKKLEQREEIAKGIYNAAKEQNFIGKLAYDYTRFGLDAAGKGAAAGWQSVATTWAIDGALTEFFPFAMIDMYDANLRPESNYGLKEAAGQILLAGTISGALPIGGRLMSKGWKALNIKERIVDKAMSAITKKANEARDIELRKGHEAVLGNIDNAEKACKNAVSDIMEMAKKEKINPVEQKLAQEAHEIVNSNYTDDEMQVLLTLITKEIKAGRSPEALIQKLNLKSTYMSQAPGVRRALEQVMREEGTAGDFIQLIQGIGHNIIRRGSEEGTSTTDQILLFLKDPSKITSAKIEGDSGKLGAIDILGLDKDGVDNMLHKAYVASLFDDTEAGVKATLEINQQADEYRAIAQKIRSISGHYDDLYQGNITGENKVSWAEQLQAYTLADGSQGSIRDAVKEIAFDLLPTRMKEEYFALTKKLDDIAALEAEKGGYLVISEAAKEQVAARAKEIEAWQEQVADLLTTVKVKKNGEYINLNRIQKGDDVGDTAQLYSIADKLDEMADNLEEVLALHGKYADEAPDPEDVLKSFIVGDGSEKALYKYADKPISCLEAQHLIQDETATLEHLDFEKAEFASWETREGGKEVIATVNSINEKIAQGIRDRGVVSDPAAYMGVVNQGIKDIEDLLQADFSSVRDGVVKAIQESELFKNLAEKPLAYTKKVFAGSMKPYRQSFKSILKEQVIDTLGAKLPKGMLQGRLTDAINESIDRFIAEYTSKSGMRNLLGDVTIDKEADSVATVAHKVDQAVYQKEAVADMLEPLFKQITLLAVQKQTELYHIANIHMNDVAKILKNPGRADEIALSKLTYTYYNFDGASVNTENVSDIGTERLYLNKRLLLEPQGGSKELHAYANDVRNLGDINREVVMLQKTVEEGVSDAERNAMEPNSMAGKVARAYLDTMASLQQKLHTIGSAKKRLHTSMDPSKISRASIHLRDDYANTPLHDLCSSGTSGSEVVDNQLRRMAMDPAAKLADRGNTNVGLAFFTHLDLDKMFGEWGNISLNEVRDSILEGPTAFRKFIKDNGEEDTAQALKKIMDNLFEDDKCQYGLVYKVQAGRSAGSRRRYYSARAQYLEDMDQQFHWKNTDSEMYAIKQWGFNSFEEMTDANLTRAKRAYAILNNLGSEPYQYGRALQEEIRVFASDIIPYDKKYGATAAERLNAAEQLKKRIKLNGSWDRTFNYCLDSVCGFYSRPDSALVRVSQCIIKLLSSPMLMASGWKSATDYSYLHKYLVMSGLKEDNVLTALTGINPEILGESFAQFLNKDRVTDMMLVSQMQMNTILEAVTGGDDIMALSHKNNIFKALLGDDIGPYADKITKLERYSQAYSNLMINKLAGNQWFTNNHRCTAAIMIMRSLGAFVDTPAAKIFDPKVGNKKLANMLKRHGIDEVEWDLLTEHCFDTMDNYLSKLHGQPMESDMSGKIFIPYYVDDLSDEVLATALRKRGKAHSKLAIENYRSQLMDKVSILINNSASEMVSLPNMRVQSMLVRGGAPGAGSTALMAAATQFQSFGAAVNFIHWGRTYANHIDYDSMMFEHLLKQCTGWGGVFKDVGSLIASGAVWSLAINEMLAAVKGNHQSITGEDGEIQFGVIGKKLTRAITDQTGFFGMIIDGVMGAFEAGFGVGGGVAFPAFPAVSALLGAVSRPIRAVTREGTEGHKVEAFLGGVGESVARMTGIPIHPLTTLAWNLNIGDYLTYLQMGDEGWRRRQRRREREGYANPREALYERGIPLPFNNKLL